MGRDETSGPVFVMGLALQDRQREECLDSPGMITASEGMTETVPLVITSQASDPRGQDGEAHAHYPSLCLPPQGGAGVRWPPPPSPPGISAQFQGLLQDHQGLTRIPGGLSR